LDAQNRRRDSEQRPELSSGVVEWVAPSEYMVRPPQAPSFFFVIDVSASAVRSGMLGAVSKAIAKSLDDLPGGQRTKVGFITFDTAVHYYSLKPGSSQAQMMVVGDLKELFVPAPDHLLATLHDSRDAVNHFLENLPDMFQRDDMTQECCLGPALKAAFTITKSIGGKMSIFQAGPPTLGEGAVRMRENPRLLGTPEEVNLLKPDVAWYRDTALEFSRAQIAVDLFVFPNQYVDSSSLAELPRLTAGQFFGFPRFDPTMDSDKLESLLYRRLTQPTAFETVLRIRCSKGMKIRKFYGNFNIRGTDLLALPNCNADSVFAFDLDHDVSGQNHSQSPSAVTIQSALLYTTSDGERRIRVATQALPLTARPSEILESADAEAVATLLTKQALEAGIKSNLDHARNRLIQSCVDIIRSAKEGRNGGGVGVRPSSSYGPPGGGPARDSGIADTVAIPENLRLLPLYVLALLKNVALRGGTDVHPDERIAARSLLNSLFVKETIGFVHPRLFAVHDLDRSEPGVGMPAVLVVGEDGEEKDERNDDDDGSVVGRESIRLPKAVGLTADSLSSEGIYVLDNGIDTYIWVGRASDPAATIALFGTESLENSDMSEIKLNTTGNDLASRLSTILHALHEDSICVSNPVSPKIFIVREGDAGMESRFFWNLVEDRAQFNGGTYTYPEFMQFVNNANPANIVSHGGSGSMPMSSPGQGIRSTPMSINPAPPGQVPTRDIAFQGRMMPPPPPPGMRTHNTDGFNTGSTAPGQNFAPPANHPPPPPGQSLLNAPHPPSFSPPFNGGPPPASVSQPSIPVGPSPVSAGPPSQGAYPQMPPGHPAATHAPPPYSAGNPMPPPPMQY